MPSAELIPIIRNNPWVAQFLSDSGSPVLEKGAINTEVNKVLGLPVASHKQPFGERFVASTEPFFSTVNDVLDYLEPVFGRPKGSDSKSVYADTTPATEQIKTEVEAGNNPVVAPVSVNDSKDTALDQPAATPVKAQVAETARPTPATTKPTHTKKPSPVVAKSDKADTKPDNNHVETTNNDGESHKREPFLKRYAVPLSVGGGLLGLYALMSYLDKRKKDKMKKEREQGVYV